VRAKHAGKLDFIPVESTKMSNEPRTITCGGGPPNGKGMDRRLVVLETRFDVIAPTLATKNDLKKLRGELLDEMHIAICGRTKWMIGLFLSLLVAMLGFNLVILNLLQLIPARS